MKSFASWHLAIVQCLWKSRVINSVYCGSMFTPWRISLQCIRRSQFGHWHPLVLHHNWTVKERSEREFHNGSAVSQVLWSWADGLDCHYEYYCFVCTSWCSHSHVLSPVIINLMNFSSAWPCCKRSVQIFGQFDFLSAGRYGLNTEATRSVHRFSMRPVEHFCVFRLSSYCDVSIPTHKGIELSVRRGQSAGLVVYFRQFWTNYKTFLPLKSCWSDEGLIVESHF